MGFTGRVEKWHPLHGGEHIDRFVHDGDLEVDLGSRFCQIVGEFGNGDRFFKDRGEQKTGGVTRVIPFLFSASIDAPSRLAIEVMFRRHDAGFQVDPFVIMPINA